MPFAHRRDRRSSSTKHSRRIWRRFTKNRAALIGLGLVIIEIILAVFAPLVAPYDPVKMDLRSARQPPSAERLLGADELGRDVLSRIIYGCRISLTLGLVSVGIGLSFGMLLGGPSGYFGGRFDIVVMRFIDVLMSFPTILLAILVVTMVGPGLYNAMLAVGVAQVPLYARLIRGLILKLKGKEFVDAARALGVGNTRIIIRHILPNCLSPLLVQATLNIASAILSAAALGFLGLGAQPPTPEWGAMLSKGRMYMRVAPHITIFPGLAIMLTVLAFNLMGDGLRDALDPRMSRFRVAKG
ncbi:MAG TPA: ABC transporter permease [Candidatus Heimdallarchaeota archaeon]|nr:ABC transporter permease [Candidatus Heimdallarchaeota archaeon]